MESTNSDTEHEKTGEWTNSPTGAGSGGAGEQPPQPPKPRSQDSTGRGDADSEAFQLNWVHLLCFALFLDGLWLVHRVLHTVDTAERILYGEPIVIDCTEHAYFPISLCPGARNPSLIAAISWSVALAHAHPALNMERHYLFADSHAVRVPMSR
ncbi:unnamed protein product [Dibothriocephalus latus]|uniref:Uncharacterized protein n=1 Tax=Dibothriocephalus latus TaxID=60516 RepID=A0A3P7MS92_DIBLA|nr:unnamed protein product [Dibothriocephalus latus]